MIKTVIKRNGQAVPFEPEKLNKLSSWATGNINWSDIALKSFKKLEDGCTVSDIVTALISTCIDKQEEEYFKIAGKLWVSDLYKRVFPDTRGRPEPFSVFSKKMFEKGYYLSFSTYTKEDMEYIDSLLDCDKDLLLNSTQMKQLESMYLVKNKVTNTVLEVPQYMAARIALAVYEDHPKEERLSKIKTYLENFIDEELSLPTPNLANIGTTTRTGTSCCLYTAEDTAPSINATTAITEMMTVSGAGLGHNLVIRSIKDSFNENGVHKGKLPYYRAHGYVARANSQGIRGGALTVYYPALDPEVMSIIVARNPKTPTETRVSNVDFACQTNPFFVEKMRKGLDWMLISYKVAPDLYEAFYSENIDLFIELYEKYEKDNTVPKNFIKARTIAMKLATEEYETGRAYSTNTFEINRHSPFYDPILSSNLCLEITLPTFPFQSVKELYEKYSSEYAYIKVRGVKKEIVVKDLAVSQRLHKTLKKGDMYEGKVVEHIKRKNEIALCNIGAISLKRDYTDEEYFNLCYNALKTVDYVIYNSVYVYENVEYTAKQRMSAGIGLMNVAYEMARKNLKYTSEEGMKHLHFLAERHMYFLIKASIAISKERGVAPWMGRTKWVEGWTPLDTYNKNVDDLADFKYVYDWTELKTEIKENGGIGHSSLVAHMPGESSSQRINATNSLYMARGLKVIKTDGNKTNVFLVPESKTLGDNYEFVWDTTIKQQVNTYAIFQKFADQAISADFGYDFTKPNQGAESLTSSKLLGDISYKCKMGLKTQYYTNSFTEEDKKKQEQGNFEQTFQESACSATGGCEL